MRTLYERLKPQVKAAIDDEIVHPENEYSGKRTQQLIEKLKKLNYVADLTYADMIDINHLVFVRDEEKKHIYLVEFINYFEPLQLDCE